VPDVRTSGLGLEAHGEQKTTRCFVISPKAAKGRSSPSEGRSSPASVPPFIWADLVYALLCPFMLRGETRFEKLKLLGSGRFPSGIPPEMTGAESREKPNARPLSPPAF